MRRGQASNRAFAAEFCRRRERPRFGLTACLRRLRLGLGAWRQVCQSKDRATSASRVVVILKVHGLQGYVAAVVAAFVVQAAPGLADSAIVVAGPATGRHAGTLVAMAAGARRAIAGRAIRMTEVDDGCEAGRAEGAARVIVADKPDLVIGHPCPAAAVAAAKVYAAAGVLFIALGVRHPDLTDKRAGPTIFRLAGRDDRQGQAAAAELLSLAPQGKIAIVQDRTAYARSLTAAVTGELALRKSPPPAVIPIVAGRRDYDAELQKLKGARPEAIFFAGYPSEASVVLRSLRKAGITATLIASDANATDEFGTAAASVDPSTPSVKVMMRAPQSGGIFLPIWSGLLRGPSRHGFLSTRRTRRARLPGGLPPHRMAGTKLACSLMPGATRAFPRSRPYRLSREDGLEVRTPVPRNRRRHDCSLLADQRPCDSCRQSCSSRRSMR